MKSRLFVAILFSILFIAVICFYLNKTANAGQDHYEDNLDMIEVDQSPRPTPVCSPSESPKPTELPTPTPQPTPFIITESTPGAHIDDGGDGRGCAVNDCSGNKIGSPTVDTYPYSPYDGSFVGWK